MKRLVTISHSYCVRANRELARAMARATGPETQVTALGPARFKGDLRWVDFEPESAAGQALPAQDNSLRNYKALPVKTRLGRFIHAMAYGADTRAQLQHDWNVVHAWEEPYIWSGFQLSRWTPAAMPFVFSTFQNIEKQYPWPFSSWERQVVNRCDGWIAFGHTVRQAMLQRQGYAQKPHAIIPPGVDAEQFVRSEAMRSAGFQKLGWHLEGPPVIGFLGRFIPEKGLGVLMEALSALTAPWRALFVGGGSELPKLTQWASGFGDRIRILCGVLHDEVVFYLNTMDILCAPSVSTRQWREQFGRMIIEAFACGVAVVGSSSGEIPHTIGDAGIIVPESDPRALGSVLRQLIEHRGHVQTLAQQGRQRVEAQFSWPLVAKRHLEFFSEVERRKRSESKRRTPIA